MQNEEWKALPAEERRKRVIAESIGTINEDVPVYFSEEELHVKREELANIDIQLSQLADEKKSFMTKLKADIEPLKDRHGELLEDIKHKYAEIEMTLHKVPDYPNRVMNFYDDGGNFIKARPLLRDEFQYRIVNINRAVNE